MKKLMIGAAALALVAGGFSCGNGGVSGGKVSFSGEKDSVAYSLGILQGKQYAQNIRYSAEQGQKIDSMEFLRGIKDGLSDSTKFAYFAGALTGVNISRTLRGDSLNTEIFLKAFRNALLSDSANLQITDSLAQAILQTYGQRKQAEQVEKQFGQNKKKGAAYLEAFKKEAGVQTTASGLAYKVEKEGTGATPTTEDKVKVKYKGTLIDGKEFDANETEFPVTGVIKGWTEILQLMKEGEKIKVVIPYNLAYGESGTYGIDPFSTLVFEMELIKVTKGAGQTATNGPESHDGHAH